MSRATRTQDVSVVERGSLSGCFDWPRIAQHVDAHGWRSYRNISRRASARRSSSCTRTKVWFVATSSWHGMASDAVNTSTSRIRCPKKVTALHTALYAHLARSPTGGAFRWDSINATPTRRLHQPVPPRWAGAADTASAAVWRGRLQRAASGRTRRACVSAAGGDLLFEPDADFTAVSRPTAPCRKPKSSTTCDGRIT